MGKSVRKTAAAKKKPRSYHHGNLRAVLIEATLRLVEEGGPEAVTVREAARRAGVSSGAPFRHFPNRTVLMTAVAEEATHQLHAAIFDAVEQAARDAPLARLRAMGRAYLLWASTNPTHFAVVSNRSLIDYDSSPSLKRENEEIQNLMERLLDEALQKGEAVAIDQPAMKLASRALVYGLARMRVDGHLPQWTGAKDDFSHAMEEALDLFIAGLGSSARSSETKSRQR